MEVKVLSVKKEEEAMCFLCETTLHSYVNSLKSSYKKYDVQRGIVKNIYLDRMSDTIFKKGHIPPMVLVLKKNNVNLKVGSKCNIDDFNILDGLQRSFRIKRIWDSGIFYFEKLEESLKITRSYLIKNFEKDLIKADIDATEVVKVVNKIQAERISENYFEDLFQGNIIWFEIWTNLNKEQQISKMLTLNAGHKPMQTRHQLELLFLNLELVLESNGQDNNEKFSIIREREVTVSTFQKNKKPYQYHLSILISSVISFIQGKVIVPGISMVKEIHDQGIDSITSDDDFNLEFAFDENFYDPFLSCIIKMDTILKNDEESLRWSARETVLPGIMAGLGKFRIEKKLTAKDSFKEFNKLVSDNGTKFFNIQEFEAVRSSIPIQKVNVGKYLRELLCEGVFDALSSNRNKIRWKNIGDKKNKGEL